MRAGNRGPAWLRGWAAYPIPKPMGSRAPVFLVSLHLLQVGAATLFHLLQRPAPARGCLPAWEPFGQCLQPFRLLGHHLLHLCPKQQRLMGGGSLPGAQGGDGWARRSSGTPREGPLKRPGPDGGQPAPSPPPAPTAPPPLHEPLWWEQHARQPTRPLDRASPLTTLAVCKATRSGRALKVLFSCRNKRQLFTASHPRSQLEGPLTAPGPGGRASHSALPAQEIRKQASLCSLGGWPLLCSLSPA